MAGDFALLFISGLIFSFAGSTQTDMKIFTVTYYVRPGTNRLPLVPYENALELKKNVDYVSWYIQDQLGNNTWIGGGRVDENGWKISMASGYKERYSVLQASGSLEIQNITIDDDGALYLGTVLGEYNGQHQYRLRYFDPNAETSNGNLTSLRNCSEHNNSSSPVGHIDPQKETSNGNLTSLRNCSEHNNSSSPVGHIEPPKEKCIGWIVAFVVVLAYPLYCIGHRVVNIAKRIFISCCHWYTHNFSPAVAEVQMSGSSGGEKCQDCDSQKDGRGTKRESEMKLQPYISSETLE